MERIEALAGAQPCYYVLQAEVNPKSALTRLLRSRARLRKKKAESAPATLNSIEVLETRNVERRG
jgi:hypothetical protein